MENKRTFLIKIFDVCRQIDKAKDELKTKLIHDAEDIYDEHFNNLLNEQTIEVATHFYNIGDIVKYKNTRGNIKEAEITGFKEIEKNKKWWFYGIDTKTKAKVFYPEHLSIWL